MPPQSPSLFLSAERAAALTAWRSPEADVVSLHLAIDAAGSYPGALDRLLRDSLEADPLLRAAVKDVERIAAFVRGQFSPSGRRGLCAVSCAKRGLFEAFALPEPLKTTLTVSDRPAVRPLESLAHRYRRFLALLVDARRARFIEIHFGESLEVEEHEGDFLGAGLEALAERAAALVAGRRVDRLVLGAAEPALAALGAALPKHLQEALILEPLLGPDRPLEAVADRVRHNENESLKVRETVLVRRFLDQIKVGGAVAGLEAVAGALQQGCAKRILVREGWAKMGRCCPACRRLSLDHRSCPWCFRATTHVLDVVAELVDRAVEAGVEVSPVAHHPDFDSVGRIGAELAAPAAPRREVPTARALRARFALKNGRASPLRPRPDAD
jgi:hypothetical protein